jgi:FAD:protein FMN transferase
VAITDIVVPGRRVTRMPASRTPGSPRAAWPVWGTTASVTVDDPAALNVARRIVARQFAAAEKAAARFRPDAELHKLYRAGGRPVTISPLLAELVAAALAVAARTDGDVDPTVGAAMTAFISRHRGRDRSRIPVCGADPTDTDPTAVPAAKARPAAGWEQVCLEGRRLQVPAGTTLDLSATAKAVICDLAAARVRERLDAGVLVQLGGNAASAGPAPDEGWQVPVENSLKVYLAANSALSTSRKPVIDPHTGNQPRPVWQSASAIGFTCLEAATYSTAALVRGTRAVGWLTQLWVPSRLVTVDDDEVLAGNWAAHIRPYNEKDPN